MVLDPLATGRASVALGELCKQLTATETKYPAPRGVAVPGQMPESVTLIFNRLREPWAPRAFMILAASAHAKEAHEAA